MVQQRHNEGYGLVIRSEKDDIWERLSGSEAFRLEEKLLDEVEYRTYHNRIEKLDSLSACREMNFELMGWKTIMGTEYQTSGRYYLL